MALRARKVPGAFVKQASGLSPSVSLYFINREGGSKTDKSEEERLQRAKLQAEAAEK